MQTCEQITRVLETLSYLQLPDDYINMGTEVWGPESAIKEHNVDSVVEIFEKFGPNNSTVCCFYFISVSPAQSPYHKQFDWHNPAHRSMFNWKII